MWYYAHLVVLLMLATYLYCWIAVGNDYFIFNKALYEFFKFWFNWTQLILYLTALLLTCQAALFFVQFCKIPTYSTSRLSLISKIFVVFIGLVSTIGYITIAIIWKQELYTVALFLRITWPYLHPTASILTAVIVCIKLYISRERCSTKYVLVIVWVYSILFLLPLLIKSPCVKDNVEKCKKPLVLGSKGNRKVAPEHTLMSFDQAINADGYEVDVSVTMDGVPFLMQDNKLVRTTDVNAIYPSRSFNDAESFNWQEIQKLNAGEWFLQTNPFLTAGGLSDVIRKEIAKQQVMSLYKLAVHAKANDKRLLVNMHRPRVANHPHLTDYIQVITESILASGIVQSHVLWTTGPYYRYVLRAAPGFRQVHKGHVTTKEVVSRYITLVMLEYNKITRTDVDRYRRLYNISSIVYTSATEWTFSLAWCQCAYAVISDDPIMHSKLDHPIWSFTLQEYKTIWLSWYIISAVASAIALAIHFRTLKHFSK